MNKEVTISGQRYQLELLDAVTGRELLLRLVRALGPSVRSLELDDPARALSSAAGGFLTSLDPVLFKDLCDTFGAASCLLGKDGPGAMVSKVFGEHFAGKYMAMLEWLYACLEYNYTDFLGETGLVQIALRKAIAKMSAKDQTGPGLPTTSTGT